MSTTDTTTQTLPSIIAKQLRFVALGAEWLADFWVDDKGIYKGRVWTDEVTVNRVRYTRVSFEIERGDRVTYDRHTDKPIHHPVKWRASSGAFSFSASRSDKPGDMYPMSHATRMKVYEATLTHLNSVDADTIIAAMHGRLSSLDAEMEGIARDIAKLQLQLAERREAYAFTASNLALLTDERGGKETNE